jgi:hypothetical protein
VPVEPEQLTFGKALALKSGESVYFIDTDYKTQTVGQIQARVMPHIGLYQDEICVLHRTVIAGGKLWADDPTAWLAHKAKQEEKPVNKGIVVTIKDVEHYDAKEGNNL